MDLDDDRCYRALVSRDARFDGRFWTAVKTTGIYCRPVCPARTPRRENVTFYGCAAAAAEAGYRPCLRCRPETSPGTPAWQGTSATVARALRLIEEGALDDSGVGPLADRLGVGERHLRRLFQEHLGASPLAVAKTRRIHFAKRLIDATALPMTEIAHAAGFASVRRFNACILETYGRSPSALRDARAPARARTKPGGLELRLPFRRPFDWKRLLAYLAPRAIPGVEAVSEDAYRRVIDLDDRGEILEVRMADDGEALVLSCPATAARGLYGVVHRVRELFDLGTDPEVVSATLSADPLLRRKLARMPGLRVPGAFDPFEFAVRAILGQQVTVVGASTLAGRLVERFGRRLDESDGVLTHRFPEPRLLERAAVEEIGVPSARAEAIRQLARGVARNEIDLRASASLDETLASLTTLPGVGPWTASLIAMRALREPDAFPEGDLGIRKALVDCSGKGVSAGGALGRPRLPTPRAVLERAETWRPFRAYAALLLWTDEAERTVRSSRRSRAPARA